MFSHRKIQAALNSAGDLLVCSPMGILRAWAMEEEQETIPIYCVTELKVQAG